MKPPLQKRRAIHPAERGFTLIEILVVVAIIGILGSIAVPGLKNAMRKSKKNATIAELRVFRDSMQRYAGDKGHFPTMLEFDMKSLAPLQDAYMKRPERLVNNLSGAEFELYIPWNPLVQDDLTFSMWENPQSINVA